MAKILITGGAGAIGSNLAHALIQNQHEIIILDDLSSGRAHNLPKEITFFQGSILNDELLASIFNHASFDYVFHLAALFANQNSVEHPQKDLQVNGLGTLKILEKAHQHKVKKLIYTSSSCVYGNMTSMREDKPLESKLDTPYAITKLLGEQYCQFYSTFHGLDTVILRLFNSYGPGEMPGQYRNVIPNFMAKAMKKESLIITGTGQETRDFTFVGDVIEGLMAACFKTTKPGDIFNLGSGIQTSIQTLVDAVNKITKNPAPCIYKERRDWDHVLHRVATIDKAKAILDYKPITSLEYGLQKTYGWHLENVR